MPYSSSQNSSASSQSLRVALAQLNLIVGDIQGNAERVIETARRARRDGQADLVVFPELTLCAYPPEDLLFRDDLYSAIDQALGQIQHAVQDIDLIIGCPLKKDGQIFNSAIWIHQGNIEACYHKQQLPNYGVFDEKRYFSAGNQACVVTCKNTKLALTICEDLWWPGVAEQAKAAGAELLINLNASPYHTKKMAQRHENLSRRCSVAGLPVIYVNLIGGQDELVFDGRSLVVDAQGECLFQAPAFAESLDVIDIYKQPSGVGVAIQAPESQPPALSSEALVYQALVLGVKDYVEKNGFPGVVIGLSGGIDSALTAAVAVDALGAERVKTVMMPSQYTSQMSLDDAQAIATALGIEYHSISIERVFGEFLKELQPLFNGLAADTTEENIQARCRGIILMAIANKEGKIVLTTGNKSEMAVGYATLYGDMAGGFAPIKDVPKTLVYRLSRYRNTLGEVIPERVITRPPSAELAPDQKDEDSLPPYDVLDPILDQFVAEDASIGDIIAKGYDAETVSRVARMVYRNEYKRRQAPPGVRISERAFGRDRRYPITSKF